MICRRTAQFAALSFALSAVAAGCLPDDDCSVTATCPPSDSDAAQLDGPQAADRTLDASRLPDSSTMVDASVDTVRSSGEALMGDDRVVLGDRTPFSDASPDADGQAGQPADAERGADGRPKLDAEPREDAQPMRPADGGVADCGACQSAALTCGDGVVNGAEQCDKGKTANVGGYGGCNADCTFGPRCGDGVKNGSEACDDGNSVDSDGCTKTCQCGDGTKPCNGTCIANATCCKDAECGANATCTGAHACQCAGALTLCPAGCLDTKTDAENCGACGHSCLGGGCQAGICLPVVIGTSPRDILNNLAVNATTVFTTDWTVTTVNVYAAPKTKSVAAPAPALTTIVTIPSNSQSDETFASFVGASDSLLMFAISNLRLDNYFTDLYSCNPAQCAATLKTWFTAFSGWTTCDLVQQQCYSLSGSGELFVSTFAVSTPQPFSPSIKTAAVRGDIGGLAVGAGFVYAAGISGSGEKIVERVPTDGSTRPVRLANQGKVAYGSSASLSGPVLVTSNTVFVTNDNFSAIFAIPLPFGFGESPATAFFAGSGVGRSYADDNGLFWFDFVRGQLLQCPIAGCNGSPSTRANGSGGALTSDGQALYWLETYAGTGARSIMKLAR